MNFNLDIKIINDILKEPNFSPLRKELKQFPERRRIGQNILKAGYKIPAFFMWLKPVNISK